MEKTVYEVLSKLGLTQYEEIFSNNEIDYEMLLSMDKKLFAEVVPKLGHRIKLMKFIENIEKYDTAVLEKSISTASTVILNDKSGVESNLDTSTEYLTEETYGSSSMDVSIESLFSPPKKTRLMHSTRIFGENKNVEDFLKLSRTGQALLDIHSKIGSLNVNERSHLVHMIADELCEHNTSVSNEQFSMIANELVLLIPGENSTTYFIPPEGSRKIACGKLIDRFRNQRKLLCKAKRAAQPASEPTNSNITFEQEVSMKWLEHNTAPWGKVQEEWRKTRQTRMDVTKNIEDYYKILPALQMPLGYTLLEDDFAVVYPGKESSLIFQWTRDAPKLWNLLVKHKRSKLTGLYEDQPLNDITNLKLLRELPALLPAGQHKSSRHVCWRPSFTESQDGFILVIENASDLRTSITKRNVDMTQHGTTAQPIIVVVLPCTDIIEKIFVVVNNVHYVFTTILKAVECSLIIHLMLNAKYNVDVENIYLFLQRNFFQIKTQYDKLSACVAQLLQKMDQ